MKNTPINKLTEYKTIIWMCLGLVMAFVVAMFYALGHGELSCQSFIEMHKPWYIVYSLIFLAVILLCFVFGYTFLQKDTEFHPWRYVLVMILLGIICSMAMPPLCVPDGIAHYNNPLYVSNLIFEFFGIDAYLDPKLKALQIFGDASYYYDFWHGIGDGGFLDIMIYDHHFGHWFMETMPLYAYYLPGAVIAIFRLLHVPFQIMIIGARFANLMMFTAANIVCIRLCPYMKRAILTMSFLPSVIWMTNSFSYDCMVLTLSNLFICYCLYCRDKEKVTWRDFILLALFLGLIVPLKMVYAMLALMIFIIPRDKIGIKHLKAFAVAALCSVVLIVIALFVLRGEEIVDFLGGEMDPRAVVEGQMSYSIGYVIRHPFMCLFVLFHTFIKNTSLYVLNSVNGENFSEYVPHVLLFAEIAVCLASLCVAIDRDKLRRRDRVIACASFIFNSLLVLVAFLFVFSKVRNDSLVGLIDGVQGRYFLPMFLLIPMMISWKSDLGFAGKRRELLLYSLLYLDLITLMFKYTGVLFS